MPGPRAKKEESMGRPRGVGRPKKGTGPIASSTKITTIVPAGLAIALENEAADKNSSISAIAAEWLAFALAEKWSAR